MQTPEKDVESRFVGSEPLKVQTDMASLRAEELCKPVCANIWPFILIRERFKVFKDSSAAFYSHLLLLSLLNPSIQAIPKTANAK